MLPRLRTIFGIKQSRQMEMGDVVYESKYHFPNFPAVVIGILKDHVTVLGYHHNLENGRLFFMEKKVFTRQNIIFNCENEVPTMVKDFLTDVFDCFQQTGVAIKDNGKSALDHPIMDFKRKSWCVIVQMSSGKEFYIEDCVSEEHAAQIHTSLMDAKARKETWFVPNDPTRAAIDTVYVAAAGIGKR